VLEAVFIGSHSLPPLWFAVSVLQASTELKLCRLLVLGVGEEQQRWRSGGGRDQVEEVRGGTWEQIRRTKRRI
jgi:hypothetical protein